MKKLLLALLLALGLAAPAFGVVNTTSVGDAAYTILSTDTEVVTSVAFSAARTWTLPSAGATLVGQGQPASGQGYPRQLEIIDLAGAVTSSNTLTIARQTGETINGAAANLVINYANARVILVPTSGTNWQAYVSPPNGQIVGTATNDSASAGNVGEVLTSTVASGSAVSLSSATGADITTLSLTAGDWDCKGNVVRNLGATTSVTILSQGIGTSANTVPALGTMASSQLATAANVMVNSPSLTVGPVRISVASTTTIHLAANDTFTVSTDAGYGQLTCRRAR